MGFVRAQPGLATLQLLRQLDLRFDCDCSCGGIVFASARRERCATDPPFERAEICENGAATDGAQAFPQGLKPTSTRFFMSDLKVRPPKKHLRLFVSAIEFRVPMEPFTRQVF